MSIELLDQLEEQLKRLIDALLLARKELLHLAADVEEYSLREVIANPKNPKENKI